MADLTKFEGVIKTRPTQRYYESEQIAWDRDSKALNAELDAAEAAGRDAEALREQMTAQARHVADLEFEVARLTRLLELQPEPAPTTETEEQK